MVVVVGMWYSGVVSGEMLYGGSGSILCSGSGDGRRNTVGGGGRVEVLQGVVVAVECGDSGRNTAGVVVIRWWWWWQ